MPHATLPSPGLQAFILCGPGVSLNTFTSNPKEFPKALIPIANRPMVWYPLDWCYRMGVTDITLITPAESAPALQSALDTHPALTSLPSPKPEILAPEELTQTTGTGELFRLPQIRKAVTQDFVVLPCDLVCELDGTKLWQQWMVLQAGSGKKATQRGGLGVWYPTQGTEGISTKKDETDFIATVPLLAPTVPPPHGSLRNDVEQLVLAMPTDTLNDKMEDDKGFKMRHSLLKKYGRVKMKTKHRDAHVYIFPKWTLDFLGTNETFESVAEDVLGWWAKSSWQDGLAEKLGLRSVLEGETKDEDGDDAMAASMQLEDEVELSALSTTSVSRPAQQRANDTSFASRVPFAIVPQPSSPALAIPPFLAYVQPAPTGTPAVQDLIRRVDTSAALLNVSLHLAKQGSSSFAHEHKVSPRATVGQQSRVSQEDSLIAENVSIGTRVNIKECVIGANSTIGNNARLTRCLLMENVHVGDGVQLTGCIVGRRARIEGATPPANAAGEGTERPKRKKGGEDEDDRTKLTECEVAPSFVVDAGTVAKGEKMMAFDTEDFEDGEGGEGLDLEDIAEDET